MTPPLSRPENAHEVARWAAELAREDPSRPALWLQRASGGVAWFRTAGELPLGSSASGCRHVATITVERALQILEGDDVYYRWHMMRSLVGQIEGALAG